MLLTLFTAFRLNAGVEQPLAQGVVVGVTASVFRPNGGETGEVVRKKPGMFRPLEQDHVDPGQSHLRSDPEYSMHQQFRPTLPARRPAIIKEPDAATVPAPVYPVPLYPWSPRRFR